MKIGEYVLARTHAQLLNELLGTNYKSWMKSGYNLPDGKLIWMIELGNFVSSSGFINRLTTFDRISEKHVEKDYAYGTHSTYKSAVLNNSYKKFADRVVFDIIKGETSRKYIFRGVFRLNEEESTVEENIWTLVSDEYTL